MAASIERIAAEVAHGLDSCCGDDYPLARIAECLERLRQSGWRARDRHLVERTLLRALNRIADSALETGGVARHLVDEDRPFCSTARQLQEVLERRAAFPPEPRGEEYYASNRSRPLRRLG